MRVADGALALHSELVKLSALRPMRVLVGLFAAGSIGLGGLAGWSLAHAIETGNPNLIQPFNAAEAGFDAIQYGLLLLLVAAVLAGAVDKHCGMLRMSLLARPSRAAYVAAKAAAVAAIAAVLTAPIAVLSYLATEAALGSHGQPLDTPGVATAVAGISVSFTLMCLFALGLGIAARSAVPPLVILLPMVLAGSQLLSLFAPSLAKFLPDRAGAAVFSIAPDAARLSPIAGLAVLVAWTTASLSLALLATIRRDA